MKRNPHIGGTQLLLITPDSDWVPPISLPDLRGKVSSLALDTEGKDEGLSTGRGSGWPTRAGYIAGLSAAWKEGEQVCSFYAPIAHPEGENFDPNAVAQWVKDHAEAGIEIITHHGAHDHGWMRTEWGLKCPPRMADTEAMAMLVDEERLNYSLDSLCRWRGLTGKDERGLREAAAIYGVDPKSELWRLPARYVGPYAEADAQATLLLAESLRGDIEEQGLGDALRLELDLMPMVLEMRLRGIRVDLDAAAIARDRLLVERDVILADLTNRLGHTVSIEDLRSRKLEDLFGEADAPLPPMRTEKTGRVSFQGKWMQKQSHWFPKAVAKAEQLTDMADKFIEGFIFGFAHNGRIHASINQYRGEEGGTRSYRFSYAAPPLQQAPARDEEMSKIFRGSFCPDEGAWLSCDYCFDDQTEILTEEGWIHFPELDTQKVAQWDNGFITFVKPLDIYRGANGYRQMVYVNSKCLDFCVTQNHRCLLASQRDDAKTVIVEGRDLFQYLPKMKVLQTGLFPGENEVPDALIQLTVALQADASDRMKWNDPHWNFFFKKSRKIERLVNLLDKLKCSYQVIPPHDNESRTFIRVKDEVRLRTFLDEGKTFNLSKLLALTPRLRQLFLTELKFWDGTNTTPYDNYCTGHKQNAETVQIIATCTGRRAAVTIWEPNPKKIALNYWMKQNLYIVNIGKRTGTWGDTCKIKTKRYFGRVYCVTVPSGVIITRRNNKVTITGQSQQEYRLIVHFANAIGLDKANEAAQRYIDDPNTDFHSLVAEWTGLERKPAKDCNFAKSYGAGIPKFAAMIGSTIERATAIMNQYDEYFPFVKQLGQVCQRKANDRGYIKLLDGARSHFDRWEVVRMFPGETYSATSKKEARQKWGSRSIRRAFVHKAMNRLIQGSAARQTKMWMRACWQEGFLPLLQMHDELCFDITEPKHVEHICRLGREVIQLTVPMKVDAELGHSWGSVGKYKNWENETDWNAGHNRRTMKSRYDREQRGMSRE